MGYHLRRLDAIIVAVGQFNPAIVSPHWLGRHGLISDSDVEDAMSKLQALVQEGLMSFDAGWFSFRLVQQQMVLSTISGATPRLRDLATGIFRLLPETPVTAIGINFAADVQFDEAHEYHRFGDRLVPKGPWSKMYPGLNAGVASLQIAIDASPRLQISSTETMPEQRRFTIQPSNVVAPNAVHIAFNHHYPIPDDGGARVALELLTQSWTRDLEEAENKLMELVGMMSAEA